MSTALRRAIVSTSALAALAAIAPAAQSPAPRLQPEFRTFLEKDLKFSRADFADLEGGKVVTHALGAAAPGEVAAVGAVRVHVSRHQFVDRYRDIVQFKRGPDVLQIGRFGQPPLPEDLAALSLAKEDVDLRNCRVGHCDIRLSSEVIGRAQREIDWKAADADQRAAAWFKHVLFEHVLAYVSGRPGRMLSYDDEKRAVHPVEDFNGLLENSPYIDHLAAGLAEHLRDFAAKPLEGAEDFLYWSKEKFGITPFVTVTQVTIAPPSPTSSVIASKDVYSSRYFDASLTVTVASDAEGSHDDIYLVYVNRSRASALKGTFSSLRRSIVERRARASLDENLRSVKLRLEGAR